LTHSVILSMRVRVPLLTKRIAATSQPFDCKGSML
jgi:Na+-translocating ferredoxin:NAD+ oxidoreductase RnfC subunit